MLYFSVQFRRLFGESEDNSEEFRRVYKPARFRYVKFWRQVRRVKITPTSVSVEWYDLEVCKREKSSQPWTLLSAFRVGAQDICQPAWTLAVVKWKYPASGNRIQIFQSIGTCFLILCHTWLFCIECANVFLYVALFFSLYIMKNNSPTNEDGIDFVWHLHVVNGLPLWKVLLSDRQCL